MLEVVMVVVMLARLLSRVLMFLSCSVCLSITVCVHVYTSIQ